jgi:hypothetical protein
MQFRKKPKEENLTGAAKIGAYLRHAAQEPRVLDRGRVAIDSTRSAYKRIRKQNASPPAQLNDQKLWRDVRRAVEALRDASVALRQTSTERSRGRRVAFAGAALGVLAVAAVALIWKDKLRSQFSSETTGTEDEVGSEGALETTGGSVETTGGSVETTGGSVETTVQAPPQVAPPSSEAPSVQAPLSPTDDGGD